MSLGRGALVPRDGRLQVEGNADAVLIGPGEAELSLEPTLLGTLLVPPQTALQGALSIRVAHARQGYHPQNQGSRHRDLVILQPRSIATPDVDATRDPASLGQSRGKVLPGNLRRHVPSGAPVRRDQHSSGQVRTA